jgi:catechol 2,3-dioxygenase-like lactoylglutathione lyase family enzyme
MTRSLMVSVSLAMLATAPAWAAAARPPITGVSHIAVYAADTAQSDYFYTHDLGGVKRDDPENPNGVRYYFNPTQFVEVLPLAMGTTSVNRLDHVAFDTTDARGLLKYLAAHHIAVPRHLAQGSDGSKWFTVTDPEGNKVEFVQSPAVPAPIPPNQLSDHIIHVGFVVHSPDVENTFYRIILGFRPYWWGGMKEGEAQWISQQVPDGTDWIEYMVVKGSETRGIPADMPQATAGVLNHFSLGVADIETTVTLLTAGDRVSQKSDGPKIGRDGKWQFNMYDPDGTRAEFMEFHAVTKPCCSPFTAADPSQ